LDYSFGQNDIIGFGVRLGERKRTGISDLNYDEWYTPGEIHNLYKIMKSLPEEAISILLPVIININLQKRT